MLDSLEEDVDEWPDDWFPVPTAVPDDDSKVHVEGMSKDMALDAV